MLITLYLLSQISHTLYHAPDLTFSISLTLLYLLFGTFYFVLISLVVSHFPSCTLHLATTMSHQLCRTFFYFTLLVHLQLTFASSRLLSLTCHLALSFRTVHITFLMLHFPSSTSQIMLQLSCFPCRTALPVLPSSYSLSYAS